MPESEQPIEGRDLMLRMIVERNPRRVVDIGAGEGKWGRLLHDLLPIDALEIWQGYIERHSLTQHYDTVYRVDARQFDGWTNYEVAIMGDVLEHMPKPDANELVATILSQGLTIFLSVPVTDCPQEGEPFGNPYEKHVAQWTHEELIEAGWVELHRGPVPSGLAVVGTYWRGP